MVESTAPTTTASTAAGPRYGGMGNRGRTMSDATTSTFPIKRITYRNQPSSVISIARERHDGIGTTDRSTASAATKSEQQQELLRQKEQQEREAYEAEKKEARIAAIKAAKLATLGVNFNNATTAVQVTTTTTTGLLPPLPSPTERLRKTKNTIFMKNPIKTKRKSKQSYNGRELKKKISLPFEQEHQSQPFHQSMQTSEEKQEIDDDASLSFTFGTRTITTAPTQTSDGNAQDSRASVAEKAPKKKRLKQIFYPKKQTQKMPSLTQSQMQHIQLQEAEIERERQLQKELSDLSSSAWTCGVCGTPFSSAKYAEDHELICLVSWAQWDKKNREVVGVHKGPTNAGVSNEGESSAIQDTQQTYRTKLQQGRRRPQDQTFLTLDTFDSRYEDQSYFDNEGIQHEIDNNSISPSTRDFHRKDSLEASNSVRDKRKNVPRSVVPRINMEYGFGKENGTTDEEGYLDARMCSYVPPKTGGEINLPSADFKKYIILTDDATVKIGRRLRHVLYALCREQLVESYRKNRARSNLRSLDSASSLHSTTSHKSCLEPDLTAKNYIDANQILLLQQYDAQRELAFLSRDRHYYTALMQRSLERSYNLPYSSRRLLNHYSCYYYSPNPRLKGNLGAMYQKGSFSNEQEEETFPAISRVWRSVKDRFEHAYELVKDGDDSDDEVDQYGNASKKKKRSKKDSSTSGKSKARRGEMIYDENTLYINGVVKNSVQVVNNELERMARKWWESESNAASVLGAENDNGEKEKEANKNEVLDFQFEWIRAHTQKKVIQLAALALESDFTPRKIAVQLSNDLFRLMPPQLESRGVTIQTEIEYRSGQYFVLAVNVMQIDWIILMEHTHRMVSRHRRKLSRSKRLQNDQSNTKSSGSDKKKDKKNMKQRLRDFRQRFPSRNEIVAHILTSMNRLHFIVSVPLLHIFYRLFFKYSVDKFILTVVTDDIFRYVEKKGMEMQLEVKSTNKQASFMLAALREMREDDKKRKKKKEKEGEDEDYKPILGPLLGPAVKDDKNEAKAPPGFAPPDVLEFVGLEVDLPVGFFRLRSAWLNSKSTFFKDAFLRDVMTYDNITVGKWSNHEEEIGLPKPPESVDESSFLNCTLEYSYLMPKSAFVKANMCYATLEIIYYDNYCFVLKEKTLTPEVPYGNTFIAWTQYSIVNTGKDTCRLVCSVEAEFPNGPPMVARQIKSGMRTGTAEKFVLLGETICRYADAYP